MVSNQYATDVFLRLAEEKQANIFNAAAAEFALHGFDAANTNKIAKRAGVSVGSLFQYFRTKQDLFLALVDYGTQTLLVPVVEDIRDAADVLQLFRHMLLRAREFARDYPDYNRIYLQLTTQVHSEMTTVLARRIEGLTIASYRRAMRKADEGYSIRSGCTAFVMDNLVLAFQFAFISDYYKERLLSYTGLDPLADGDALIDALCALMQELV